MTFHAFLVGHLVIVDTPGLMGLVAINTNRDLVGFLFPQFAADYFLMYLFNLPVTLLAGGRNIALVNA
jgi:hypothetical protein